MASAVFNDTHVIRTKNLATHTGDSSLGASCNFVPIPAYIYTQTAQKFRQRQRTRLRARKIVSFPELQLCFFNSVSNSGLAAP